MAPKNNIDKLDSKVRKQLIELLENNSLTLDYIVLEINKITGGIPISRSGIGRYKKRLGETINIHVGFAQPTSCC